MLFSTSIFNDKLGILTKKPKDGYSNCLADITDILCPLTFAEICNLDEMLRRNSEYMVRKVRIPNKQQCWGKSKGYRTIIICDMLNQNVYLVYVYPKKGKLASTNLIDNGANILLEEYKIVKNNGEVFVPQCPEVPVINNLSQEITPPSLPY